MTTQDAVLLTLGEYNDALALIVQSREERE